MSFVVAAAFLLAAPIADNPAAPRERRCADAFSLFRTRIHPGDTAVQIKEVLGTPTWIGAERPIDSVPGKIPVHITKADQTVVFMCLPRPDPRMHQPWSPWAIYARLQGKGASTFGAFLSSGSKQKLIEFALCNSSTPQASHCEHFPVRAGRR
jgi:hypothetical protein